MEPGVVSYCTVLHTVYIPKMVCRDYQSKRAVSAFEIWGGVRERLFRYWKLTFCLLRFGIPTVVRTEAREKE